MKIIYIAGDGRSGSTLLEMVLANIEDSISVGEAARFWKRFSEGDSNCGCGSKITECALWSGLNEFSKGEAGINNMEMATRVMEINRYRNFKKIPDLVRDPAWEAFNRCVKSFYEQIAEISGNDVIIDSSKSVPWLYYLKSLNFCEVQVIHVERALKNVANSWKKKISLPEYNYRNVEMPIKSNYTIAKNAWKVQRQLKRLRRTYPIYYVNYEQFIGSFDSCLIPLSEFLDNKIEIESIEILPNHAIGGNPIRFSENKTIKLRTREEATENLSGPEKVFFVAFQTFLNFVYR